MFWVILSSVLYIAVLAAVLLRIMYETHSSNKALAYVLLCIFVPVAGIIFYLLFGINYWNKKRYSKKVFENKTALQFIKQNIEYFDREAIEKKDPSLANNLELYHLLIKDLGSPLTANNTVTVLANGENKFPALLQSIHSATHHIHLEYYIYECDAIGMAVIEALIKKAKEGVAVRFIYDDFGSPGIKKPLEKRMTDAGIEIMAFHKIKFFLLANRFNYRNHRKIVIIDGHTAFVGGINVSDKYVNNNGPKNKMYWRDTHLKLEGPGVYYLQYLFITDWKFCTGAGFTPAAAYFAPVEKTNKDCYVQIAASGPDSTIPTILYSLLQAINLAEKEILITTPYFIPGDSIMDAISVAAMSGLSVKLLVPGISDSKIVNAASRYYYSKLLDAGVEIYLYKKGFVHAKTMVTDGCLSIIGTANMDIRSFELNFEVNALVYDTDTGKQMRNLFFEDIKNAEKIDAKKWLARSWIKQLPEKIARLLSPVL